MNTRISFSIFVACLILMVDSIPVKVSRPQAITAKNLTQKQIKTLIQENPPHSSSLLQSSDQLLPPLPATDLYLPDPERNKSDDNFYLTKKSTINNNDNTKEIIIALDAYVQPPLPSSKLLNFNQNTPTAERIQQAEQDKTSYSYNNRYDYYFPIRVVYDPNEKYAEREIQLMKMQPPIENADQHNYYAVKPKKVPKKYQSNQKDFNQNKSNEENVDQLIPIDNDGLILDDDAFVTSQPVERFGPAPSFRRHHHQPHHHHQLNDDDLNTGEYIPQDKYDHSSTESISQLNDDNDDATSAVSSDKIEKYIQPSSDSESSGKKDNSA